MKAVLFDFGGTIDTDGIHWSEKLWELYEGFGLGVDKNAYERAFLESDRQVGLTPRVSEMSFRETVKKQLTIQFQLLKVNARDGLLEEMADSCIRDVQLVVQRACHVLDEVKPHYKLALVSNFYGNLTKVCDELGLIKYFDVMVDSALVGLRKPDPAIWSLALGNLGVQPETSWVVGDSYSNDIVPSKQLGCRTIWLKGKSWTMPASEDAADYTITKFEDIKNILL